MAHALIDDMADPESRVKLDEIFEQAGHEARANVNPAYKRATWGRRPEDVAAQQAVIGDMQGRR